MTATTNSLDSHAELGAHSSRAVEGPNPAPTDQNRRDAHSAPVGGGGTNIRNSQTTFDAQEADAVAEQSPHPATGKTEATGCAPGGASNSGDHGFFDSQADHVAAPTPEQATVRSTPTQPAPARGSTPSAPANSRPTTSGPAPVLAGLTAGHLNLAAEALDDIERVRKANENRLRQLTRDETDTDGEHRGFGLSVGEPIVQRLAGIVCAMRCDSTVVVSMLGKTPKKNGCCLEHDAEKQLTDLLRKHPLGPWVKRTHGVGEKQAARLLAAIGDPYIRPEMVRADDTVEPTRPRTVSELWKYAGYKPGDRRRKGQKVNWSTVAKTRAFLIAEKCVQTGKAADTRYYQLYAKRKAHTEGRLHTEACPPCGRKGNPAAAGTPWRDGHRHADALRIVAKEVLKDLWREAKRLHEEAAA